MVSKRDRNEKPESMLDTMSERDCTWWLERKGNNNENEEDFSLVYLNDRIREIVGTQPLKVTFTNSTSITLDIFAEMRTLRR